MTEAVASLPVVALALLAAGLVEGVVGLGLPPVAMAILVPHRDDEFAGDS